MFALVSKTPLTEADVLSTDGFWCDKILTKGSTYKDLRVRSGLSELFEWPT